MLALKRPSVNLAGSPLRNRRFYKALVAASSVVFVLLAAGLAAWYLGAASRAASGRAAAEAANAKLQSLQSEQGRLAAETGAIVRKEKELVAQVNAVIARKSFSWVGFFTLLEEALPPRSYISRPMPLTAGESGFDVQFRVVSADLADQMAFLDNLRRAGVAEIQIKRESLEGGLRIAEMELRYDRDR